MNLPNGSKVRPFAFASIYLIASVVIKSQPIELRSLRRQLTVLVDIPDANRRVGGAGYKVEVVGAPGQVGDS